MIIHKAELPEFEEVVGGFRTLNSKAVTYDTLLELKTKFTGWSIDLIQDYKAFLDDEAYGAHVSVILDTLTSFQSYFSGFIGLGEGLSELLEVVHYKNNRVDDEGKKLSQGDREKYAKLDVAGVEGLTRTLKETSRSLSQKYDSINRKN